MGENGFVAKKNGKFTATTAYPCYLPVLGGSAGAGNLPPQKYKLFEELQAVFTNFLRRVLKIRMECLIFRHLPVVEINRKPFRRTASLIIPLGYVHLNKFNHMAHRYFSWIGSIVCCLFAAVQINDPDPFIWIPVYLVPAYYLYRFADVSYKASWESVGLILFFYFWAWEQFPPVFEGVWGESLTMKTEAIELARESLGLALIGTWLGMSAIWTRWK